MMDEIFYALCGHGTSNTIDPVNRLRPLLGPGSDSYRRLYSNGVLRRTIFQRNLNEGRHLHIWLTQRARRSEGLHGRCRAPSSGDSARHERAMAAGLIFAPTGSSPDGTGRWERESWRIESSRETSEW